MAIVHLGDTNTGDERGRPLLNEHKTCGKLFDPVMVCSECGEALHAKQGMCCACGACWAEGGGCVSGKRFADR